MTVVKIQKTKGTKNCIVKGNLSWLLGLISIVLDLEIFQVVLVLRVGSRKKFLSSRKEHFFVIFTMKLLSTALSYLNAHSTLNFARTFVYF